MWTTASSAIRLRYIPSCLSVSIPAVTSLSMDLSVRPNSMSLLRSRSKPMWSPRKKTHDVSISVPAYALTANWTLSDWSRSVSSLKRRRTKPSHANWLPSMKEHEKDWRLRSLLRVCTWANRMWRRKGKDMPSHPSSTAVSMPLWRTPR